MNSINRIFKVNKQNSLIDMYDKEDNTHQYLNYNKFETLVISNFGYKKANLILDYINENKSVIIDFENKKALLIKDKNPNWNNTFKNYMSIDKVIQSYRKDIAKDIPSFLENLEDDTLGTIVL